MWKCAAISIGLVLLAGCVAQVAGEPMTRAQIEQIHKGVTTREQVEAMLGPAFHVDILDGQRRLLTYWYRELDIKGPTYIPVVGLFVGGSDSRHQQLTIVIDSNNKVADLEFADVVTDRQQQGLATVVTRAEASSPPGATTMPMAKFTGGDDSPLPIGYQGGR